MLFHDEVLKKIPSKFIWVGIYFVFFSNTQGRLGISATTKKFPPMTTLLCSFTSHESQYCVHKTCTLHTTTWERIKRHCNLSEDESMHFFSSAKVISQNEKKPQDGLLKAPTTYIISFLSRRWCLDEHLECSLCRSKLCFLSNCIFFLPIVYNPHRKNTSIIISGGTSAPTYVV